MNESNRGRKWRMVCGFVVLLLFCWAWLPALKVGFIADDYEWFRYFVNGSTAVVGKIFWPRKLADVHLAKYRPLVGLFYWFDYKMWGFNRAWGYHLTNLLFHLGSCFLVYLVGKKLLSGGKKNGEYANKVGLVASLVFLFNPLLVESVTWISGRSDLIASFFILLSTYWFLLWLEEKVNKYYLLVGSLISGFFSLLAKELALVLPLILGLIFAYRYRLGETSKNKLVIRKGMWLLAFVSLDILYIILSYKALGKAFWSSQGYSFWLSNVFVLWLIVTVVLILFWLAYKRSLNAVLWLVWVLVGLSLLPVSFFPTQLRYLYLPSVFGSLFVAILIAELQKRLGRKLRLSILFSFCILLMSLIIWKQNIYWVKASSFKDKIVGEIAGLVKKDEADIYYVFNLPDSMGPVPVFRSYVEEAVKIEMDGREGLRQDFRVIIGPTPVNYSNTSYKLISDNELVVTSSREYLIFEPTVTERKNDGSLEINWSGDWQATISADRKQAEISLPRAINDDRVIGLVFNDGEVKVIDNN